MSEYFRPGSADEILASNLSNGDVLLINRRCSSLPLLEAAVCLASKYGLSGSGRGCWDHAAIVMRDPKSNVPYILEGDSAGVRFRTYEERLMQSTDHQELLWLPLRGLPDGHTRTSMETLIKDFDMRQTIDGAESTSSRCRNVWAAYRDIRSPPKKFGADLSRASGQPGQRETSCTFGAPLVASVLQQLGALGRQTDPAAVTPTMLADLELEGDSYFKRPVPIRTA
ncbi:hypothetical protein AB1Y20_019555 [Prymnesium parvum]|uniref:Uncharacterized protein n=1 Tax=Prymnesium parvum TaxID=97485 RepID=A0AB34JRD0_PRYPA